MMNNKANPERKKVILTFKPTEYWIYDEIQKHSGKSNWVKDILAAYIKQNEKAQK